MKVKCLLQIYCACIGMCTEPKHKLLYILVVTKDIDNFYSEGAKQKHWFVHYACPLWEVPLYVGSKYLGRGKGIHAVI